MKKILLVTAFPPNNKTAGQNYTKNLIKELSKENIIDIVSFSYKKHDFFDFNNKNVSYKKIIKNNIFTKIMGSFKFLLLFPFFTSRFSFRVLIYILKNLNEYDYIYLDFSQVFIYGLFIKNKIKFLMAHDIIIQKYKRKSKNFFLKYWVKYSENLVLKAKDSNILCFSNKDLNLLNLEYNLSGNKVDFFIEKEIQNQEIKEVEDYFCFYGAWGRKENLESLKWFEENIRYKLDFNIKIIGGGLKEDYKKILKDKGFEILGFVDNPYEILNKSKGLIAPLFNGAGVKVKVIEALACGTPVIGTEVALEGIELQNKFINKINSFEDIKKAIENLKFLKVEDKKELKIFFNRNYGKNKFIDLIKEC
ncbi:glycosyltransferase involved in cell wall biosynthesis [Hypnocyclicus thermotrophus]|uniref:Glycosyltransferase involved in cell wall biosynthesis n=1 Tax=Hypnocyclicus thermotrophus TaxID=1627895 RepID=A0AA46I4X1_9FUSO|nr:glycosyltransferase [Hypnocyclicus thermotrophus]TDT67879.1 glycosyltransferase involved in cell wall biosynthesis [Hypnocyclicus thermotrophus]